jgi:hypothetical protein
MEGLAFNQQPGNEPDTIPQKRGIRGMMNVAVNACGIDSNFAALLDTLIFGVTDEPLMDKLPCLGTDCFYVFLQGRTGGVLAALKPCKCAKSSTVRLFCGAFSGLP